MCPDEPAVERIHTNESLQAERKGADAVVAVKHTAEKTADAVVGRARSTADTVLHEARSKADRESATASTSAERADTAVTNKRVDADRLLHQQRVAADQQLREEREREARRLEDLVAGERANTDRYLLTERGRSDDAIAYRDDFLGMVSHDLRNLLHRVSLNATSLSNRFASTDDGPSIVEGMQRIQRDVEQMTTIIDDLVDVVSIEAGKLGIVLQRGEPLTLLREAVDAFTLAAAEKQISLSIAPSSDLPSALFDHHRIGQVLSNCLSNAIRFTPSGGHIELKAERVGRNIQMSVSDTGPGIRPDLREAVFERFWQVGDNHQRGLGLGLYISKCIVVGHQGRIWAASSPSGGCAVYWEIPYEALGVH